jgi:peptidoglycan L-alanyl-D-glutamate endopeptidase CwlK
VSHFYQNDIKKPNQDLSLLAPFVQRAYEMAAKECWKDGLFVDLYEGYRTPERQNYLYQFGRSAPGPRVTDAKANESWHQFHLAFDIALLENAKPRQWTWNGDFKRIAQYFRAHGFEWLNPYEQCHFQMTGGIKTARAKEIFQIAGKEALWAAVEERLDLL